MVFYRKYRPQTIEELDSKEVREKLYAVLGSKNLQHAFLFTGPKGLGKTSTARIVAKAINCEKNSKLKTQNSKLKTQNLETIEPCNLCEQCVSITNGNNLDVLEIDGASNRGIDEIRDLREKVKLSPSGAKRKVYIIDEVHMLTTEAFNALLKTLEEPPSHVVFVLCTTEPHKVPTTILSRCFQIQFKKATIGELVRSFERIVKGEKLNADKSALELIAQFSDGSFRDGSKVLEEVALLAGDKKITKELVENKYQISNIKYQIEKMVGFLEKKDAKRGLELVAKLVDEGVDMRYFIEELMNALHSFLLYKIGVGKSEEFSIFNFKFSIDEIKKLVELLSKAHGELKYAVLPQLPLELAIIEWTVQKTQNTQLVGVSDDQKVRQSETPITRKADAPSFPSVLKVTQQGIDTYNTNDALWQALIDKVKAYNHSVAGVLRGCNIKEYDGKNLVIETNFKFHKEKLSEKRTQDIIVKACFDVTKKNVDIAILLKEVNRKK